jgi:hypothetical protein
MHAPSAAASASERFRGWRRASGVGRGPSFWPSQSDANIDAPGSAGPSTAGETSPRVCSAAHRERREKQGHLAKQSTADHHSSLLGMTDKNLKAVCCVRCTPLHIKLRCRRDLRNSARVSNLLARSA